MTRSPILYMGWPTCEMTGHLSSTWDDPPVRWLGHLSSTWHDPPVRWLGHLSSTWHDPPVRWLGHLLSACHDPSQYDKSWDSSLDSFPITYMRHATIFIATALPHFLLVISSSRHAWRKTSQMGLDITWNGRKIDRNGPGLICMTYVLLSGKDKVFHGLLDECMVNSVILLCVL